MDNTGSEECHQYPDDKYGNAKAHLGNTKAHATRTNICGKQQYSLRAGGYRSDKPDDIDKVTKAAYEEENGGSQAK